MIVCYQYWHKGKYGFFYPNQNDFSMHYRYVEKIIAAWKIKKLH